MIEFLNESKNIQPYLEETEYVILNSINHSL
jgi:hypothetical protein